MKAGLIVNPRSGSASGKGLALAERLKSRPHVHVRIIERFEALPQMIAAMANEGVTDLFISSGDGTIQAIQTELAERSPFATLPRLCLLPHGTTNMTAADLGFRNKSLDAQAALILNPQPADVQARSTLRIANPADNRVRHGMFLGTGAIRAATEYCQTEFNARGIKGNWPVFRTLAGALARTLFSRPDPSDETRFDRPFAMSIHADGREVANGTQLLMLATTLEKLVLGARPFRERGEGAIRSMVLPYPLPNLLRWTLPLLYGSGSGALPAGAVSTRGQSFHVETVAGYVLDGEFFEGPTGEPLRIETGPLFSYVRR